MADRWYRDGLYFECTQCGHCCTGEPGYVWLTWKESEKLAELLEISLADFRQRHVRQVGSRYSLLEKPGGECVFFSREKGCTVYSARPLQCRTYPFWPENLQSRKAWTELESECPGVGKENFFAADKIELIRRGESEASLD